jgi:hypothetical protein
VATATVATTVTTATAWWLYGVIGTSTSGSRSTYLASATLNAVTAVGVLAVVAAVAYGIAGLPSAIWSAMLGVVAWVAPEVQRFLTDGPPWEIRAKIGLIIAATLAGSVAASFGLGGGRRVRGRRLAGPIAAAACGVLLAAGNIVEAAHAFWLLLAATVVGLAAFAVTVMLPRGSALAVGSGLAGLALVGPFAARASTLLGGAPPDSFGIVLSTLISVSPGLIVLMIAGMAAALPAQLWMRAGMEAAARSS